MTLKVQDISSEINEMSQSWVIVRALLGGTASMRKAGKSMMPKREAEFEGSYQDKLNVATLFPAFARTVNVMASKPFSKPLIFGDDVPSRIVEWADNIDQQGNNLHNFAFNLMHEAIAFGFCGVLVDYPKTQGIETLADERNMGVRPYFVHIKHDQVLGYKSALVNGARVLTQLRLAEEAEVDDGEFGTKEVKRVRVLEPGKWALYEERETANRKREYVLIEEGTTTLKAIPFVPFYGKKCEFMEGKSPLMDVAFLNVKHWQVQAQMDYLMVTASTPVVVAFGVDDGAKIEMGATSVISLPVGSDIKYLEHTGAATSAGEAAISKLEAQMLQSGAELLIQRPQGQRTATESNNDAEANKSDLQRIAEGVADGIDMCLQFMADWVKEPQGGHIKLFSDYGAGSLSDASAQLIVAMQQGGLLSKATALKEMQRRDIVSNDIDVDLELEAAGQDGPSLGMMGAIGAIG